ncbi:MAG: ADP-ribosylglycohydrolase family protein [Candidatus Obscuribacterales bacterium]|nr:ADP-ribosylglycohydrolase family protein [Candidatus Obscuribacterales bacterium]
MPNKIDEKVADRIRGTILASACANSMGGSCIGLTRRDIIASLGPQGIRDLSPGLLRSHLPGHEPGTILADTYLALSIADSLIAHKGKFDAADLKGRLTGLLESESFLKGAPGAPCLAALRRLADGEEPINDGSLEALHDSAAVRAYVIGCLPDKSSVVDIAVEQAKLTHADSRVWAAAAVLAESVSGFIAGKRLDDEQGVRDYVKTEFATAEKIDPRFAEYWDDVAPDLDYVHPAHELPYSLVNVESDIQEALPTAVGIFLIFRHNLEEALCNAASAGGDTDTASAIVGALAGAYHGASAIPERWLKQLPERNKLEAAADRIIALWQ